jgi:hypothetical protein
MRPALSEESTKRRRSAHGGEKRDLVLYAARVSTHSPQELDASGTEAKDHGILNARELVQCLTARTPTRLA